MSYFRFQERNTTVRREIVAGVTTFMTMAYIIFVNPAILSSGGATGIPFEAAVVSTCLGAGIMSIMMGLVSNTPFALAKVKYVRYKKWGISAENMKNYYALMSFQ